jgi:hypothetical protein
VAERALSISALLRNDDWLTFPGERAAIEGVLSAVRPSVAIEIGTFRGGTLERICAHSQEVHVFDVQRFPELTPERFPDVVFHIGDSNELLPRVLDQLAESSKNVDFVFVDAEHTKEAVRLDVESLLSSGCTTPWCHRFEQGWRQSTSQRTRRCGSSTSTSLADASCLKGSRRTTSFPDSA